MSWGVEPRKRICTPVSPLALDCVGVDAADGACEEFERAVEGRDEGAYS